MDVPTLEHFFMTLMKQKNNLPPVKIAVLIDGGFFVKRFNSLYNKDRKMTGAQVADHLYTMAMKHVGNNNTLYRIFYYDCLPLDKKVHNPISKKLVDFSNTDEYKFRMELLETLKRKRKVALRIGTLKDNHNWQIYPGRVKELLSGKKKLEELKDDAAGTIILDCKELSYISSSGLRIFITLRKAATEKGGKVIVRSISNEIRAVFMMTGFLNLFEIE